MPEATIPSEVQQSMPAALRVTRRILNAWGFSREEAAKALGVTLEQLEHLENETDLHPALTPELVERTSYLLGIEKYLEILFNNEEATIADWISRPSGAEVFAGQSPKQMLLNGRIKDQKRIRDYLAFVA
jgi:hypothetical protein